jgi:peptidyl-Lys metalloendopeptidase
MKSNGVRKLVLAAAATLLLGAQAASAGVLTATLEPQKSNLDKSDDAVFSFTLSNESNRDLWVLGRETPLQGIQGNLFDVRLNGQPVAYTGRLYKWGRPVAADYIRIPAGGSVSATIELSSVYEMAHTGEYSFQYRVPAARAIRGLGAKVAAAAGIESIDSNVAYLGVERDENLAPAFAVDMADDKALTPSYVSCSSSRQSTLVTALSNAQTISQRARDYLNNLPTASRSTDSAYRTWFGTYTSSRYSTVQSHYTNIYSTFATKTVTFYCDCTDSSYAYVFANQPYRIHLCGAFWAAPMTGIDSKAGTLVHETSHFTVVAGTQDYAYGTSACQSLAISNPSRAISNADSHEYFAETR